MNRSNANIGSDIERKSETNTGICPCRGVKYLRGVVFISSKLYHTKKDLSRLRAPNPSLSCWGLFSRPLVSINRVVKAVSAR